MSTGLGTGISTTQHQLPIPPPAPPFASNSANDGLSVDPVSGKIVLGNPDFDPAQDARLLDNRDVPMNNFIFVFRGNAAAGISMKVDDASQRFVVANNDDQERWLNIDIANRIINIGDIDVLGNITTINLDDANEIVEIKQAFRPGLSLDFLNNIYAVGDVNGFTGGAAAKFDPVNSLSQMGDVYGFANNSFISVDDIAQTVVAWSGSKQSLSLDGLNNLFQLGDWSGVHDGSFIKISDVIANSVITLSAGLNSNGATIQLDDALKSVFITNATTDMAFNINGVAGFTGTVTPVTSITVIGGIVTAVS